MSEASRRACQALSHPDPEADGFDDQLQHRAEPEGSHYSLHPETRERSLDALQWGLIPYWAKDSKIAYRTIDAHQASIMRRCLIPADGFYEWRKTAKPKLPFAIAMKDGRPFTFAGLWEGWKYPESGEWFRSCTIITGEPNALVAQIHPRMPVILPEQHHAAWLGETDDGNLKELLLPYPADQMRMWEVSAGKQPEETEER
jgi:putative SOS response-associated peptidase YedK